MLDKKVGGSLKTYKSTTSCHKTVSVEKGQEHLLRKWPEATKCNYVKTRIWLEGSV